MDEPTWTIWVVMEPWDNGTARRNLLWRLIERVAKYHVWLIFDEHDTLPYVTALNSDSMGLRLYTITRDEAQKAIYGENVVDRVRVKVGAPSLQFGWFEFLSCVTIAKRAVGIRSWRVQTPEQLMRAIRGR